MASGAKLATAYYELIPSMAGAQQKITSQLLPAVSGAGAAAGTSLGSTILGGLSAFRGSYCCFSCWFLGQETYFGFD